MKSLKPGNYNHRWGLVHCFRTLCLGQLGVCAVAVCMCCAVCTCALAPDEQMRCQKNIVTGTIDRVLGMARLTHDDLSLIHI